MVSGFEWLKFGVEAAGVLVSTGVGVVATVIAVSSTRAERSRRQRDERAAFAVALREYISEAAGAWQSTSPVKPLILPAKDFVALTEQAATFDPPNNSAINLIERVNRFNAMLVELRRTSITDKQMVADYVRPLRMGITSWVSDPDQWGATTVKFKPRRPNGRGRPVQ